MGDDIARGGVYKEITSLTNPIIKDIRGLTQRKNRVASNRFMVEGLKLVANAGEAGWPLRIFLFGKKVATHELVQKTAAKTKARGGMVIEVSEAVLAKMTRRDNPQMVIGVFEQTWAETELIKAEDRNLWIALENIKDPGNLGTIIRTADAVGAKGIILVGDTTDPFALEATRATMGSIFSLPIVKMTAEEFIAWSKKWPGLIIGTHLDGSHDYRAVDYAHPTVLFMGNEQSGLPEALSDCCTTLVKIPQQGQADSLNLAIATGVMLFEIQRDVLTL